MHLYLPVTGTDHQKVKEEISKLEQKQEKQEKDKNEITALKDKDLLDTSFSYKFKFFVLFVLL
jgi:hypothetical protein